jgi:integrase
LIWDTLQRGLAIRVQPTGARAWKAIYSRHGRPRWLTLGSADAIGLADARTLAAEAMVAVARGQDPAAEKKAKRGAGTFADLHAKYLEQHAKRRNKSWAQADALIRRYVYPRWGKLAASSITRADVRAMMGSIAAPIVANQTLAAASATFSWAAREELVPGNPCRGVERNATKARERVLADSEVPQFWQAFDDAGLVVSSALKTVLLTGQRPGEVCHMRREHIVDGWWQLPGEPVPELHWPGTKNAASHRVWLPKPVQEIIAEVSDDDGATTGFVFAGPRGRPVAKLDAAMREISKKLGVDPVTPHDLRRTFLTTTTRLGFGRDLMDRIANHKEKGSVTDIYDRHAYGAEIQGAMEAVAAHIMALVEGRSEDGKVVPIRR